MISKIEEAVIELKGDVNSDKLYQKYGKKFHHVLAKCHDGQLTFSAENSENSEKRSICSYETFIYVAKKLGYLSESGELQDPPVENKSDELKNWLYWDGVGQPIVGNICGYDGYNCKVISHEWINGSECKYPIIWIFDLQQAIPVYPDRLKVVKSPKEKFVEKLVSLLEEEDFEIAENGGVDILRKVYDLNLFKTDI